MASPLNPGSPLTREIYNSLVNEVNAIKPIATDITNNLSVRGREFGYPNLVIRADTVDAVLKKNDNDITIRDIRCDGFSSPPIVVASVYQTTNDFNLSCVVHNITASTFDVTIWRNDSGNDAADRKRVNCRIGYIAVGQK